MNVKLMPLPDEGEIYWQPLEDVSLPRKEGSNSHKTISHHSPPRRLKAGNFEMYGRVVNWVLQGKAKFVDPSKVQRGRTSGTAKVE